MSVMDVIARDATVEAARMGDERAFVNLLEPHRGTMWSVCLRVTNERQCAIDALGHGLKRAWGAMPGYPEAMGFPLWLSRVMADTARTVAWHRQRSPGKPRESAPSVSDALTDGERSLRFSLSRLPVVVRESLVLREICGLTYEQIAVHQEVGIHTVKDRLKRTDRLRPLELGPGLDRTRFDHALRAVLVRQRLEQGH